MKEIEHKFLVNKELWNEVEKGEPVRIIQGFLFNSPEKTIRVRIKGEKAYLTIKGATTGITRDEFEYSIPVHEAEQMLRDMEKTISKDRFEISYKKHTWEVDVFHGKLEGLILAELEVDDEDERFELPTWVTEDVSRDPNYYNAVLIQRED